MGGPRLQQGLQPLGHRERHAIGVKPAVGNNHKVEALIFWTAAFITFDGRWKLVLTAGTCKSVVEESPDVQSPTPNWPAAPLHRTVRCPSVHAAAGSPARQGYAHIYWPREASIPRWQIF